MWFKTEVIFPRILKSFFCVVIAQECSIALFFLVLNIFSWNPFTGIIDWLFYLIHWRTLIYQSVLCLTTVSFGILNMQYYTVTKHISSTRFMKICQALSPSHIQHVVATTLLGGIASYCCIGLLHSFDPEQKTLLGSCLHLESEFEQFFVTLHGCYTGMMFSLKYFICCLYLLKFSLDQKTKVQTIKNQTFEILKDSMMCVLKGVFWYYLVFLIIGPFLQHAMFAVLPKLHASTSTAESLIYSMLSPKLFVLTLISGAVIFFNWSLYILIFNTCAIERYVFDIDMPVKTGSNKCLTVALQNPEFDILKCLAVLDLRLLAQHDMNRRLQIFAISHPGGHPYQWNSISEVCVSSLQDLLEKLRLYSVEVAAKLPKTEIPTGVFMSHGMKQGGIQPLPSFTNKVVQYFRNWPTVCYFFDELPNSKIRQIFSTSQPLVWMAEALGFLISASYLEDKFGVLQQMLPQIVCLLLDLKMAEEKLPIDPIGIKTCVRDPQDRYEHIHQRLALKASVNSSLCRIASAFKEDAKGIYLPDEYSRYFQRFINQKNA